MDKKLRSFYLETQIKNASPGQLLIMLYDALIQFAESADSILSSAEDADARSKGAHAVASCIDILTELNTTLNPAIDPALCEILSDLYRFFTGEFSAAIQRTEPKRIRAILPLIQELRDTWFEADRQAGREAQAA